MSRHTTAPDDLLLVKDHVFPREAAMIVGVVVGIGIGIVNAMLGVPLPSWLATLGLLTLSLAVVLFLHEGLHGLAVKALRLRTHLRHRAATGLPDLQREDPPHRPRHYRPGAPTDSGCRIRGELHAGTVADLLEPLLLGQHHRRHRGLLD